MSSCFRERHSRSTNTFVGAPLSPACVHGSPHVELLALPISFESGNLTLVKAVIPWMSVYID
jgi:hypothetical protein